MSCIILRERTLEGPAIKTFFIFRIFLGEKRRNRASEIVIAFNLYANIGDFKSTDILLQRS